MSLTPARRKSLQRKRDRAAGWVEVTVKVAAGQVETVRQFAASLPPPPEPTDPRQLDLIDRIESELRRDESAVDDPDLFSGS